MANRTQVIISGRNDTGPAFEQVEKALDHLKTAAEAVGIGLSIKQFADVIKHNAELAESLERSAQKTGMTVEALAALRAQAKLTGTDWDTLQNGLKFFAKNAQAAAQGIGVVGDAAEGDAGATGKAAKAFQLLGVHVTDAAGRVRPMNDLLREAFEKLQKMPDGITKTATSMAIFGKSGDQLVPLINRFEETRGKAEDLAKTFSGLGGAELAQLAEQMREIEARTEALGLEFSAGIAPSVNRIAKSLTDATDGLSGMQAAGRAVGTVLEHIVFGAQSISYAFQKAALWGAKLASYLVPIEATEEGGSQSYFDIRGQQANIDKMIADLDRQYADKQIALNAENPTTAGRKSRRSGGIAPAITDQTKLGAQKHLLDAETRMREQQAQRDMVIAETARKSQLGELELEKTEGLVILDDYFRRRREITQAQFDEEVAALKAKEQAAYDAYTKVPGGTDHDAERARYAAQVAEIQGQIIKKQGEAAQQQQKDDADEFNGRRELRDFVLATEAELQQARGNTLAVTLDGIRKEMEERRRSAKYNGVDTSQLDAIEQARIASATAEDGARKIELIQQRLATNTERIQQAEANHAITATEAEREINQLRGDAATQLETMVADYERMAQASGNPQLIENANRLRLSLEQLHVPLSWIRDTVVNDMQSAFENFFTSIISDAPHAGNAILAWGKSMLTMINQIISRMLAMYMVQKLLGLFPSFAAPAVGAGGAAGLGNISGSIGGGFGFAAAGASAAAGQPFVVGEKGWELFVPHTAGTIVPHDKSAAMLGGGGTSVYYDFRGADQGAIAKLERLIHERHDDAIFQSVQIVNLQAVTR